MQSILLIHPSYPSPVNIMPLGLAYLAAVLEKNGINVKVLDLCVEEFKGSALGSFLKANNISVVGISSTTSQIYETWNIAKKVKDADKSILVVLGGVHPTVMPEESIGKEFVDVVVRGEGEYTLLELIRNINDRSEWSNIKGIVFKDSDGKVIDTGHREFIKDLDELPLPARHLFPFPGKYNSVGQVEDIFADILTSRGCPSNCLFCSNKATFGSVFRGRSPSKIADEIETLVSRYGIREIHISDDSFTYEVSRVIKFCDILTERRLNIPWACGNGIRVDTVTEELLVSMKKAGCYRVGLGIESGSVEIQKRLGKGITLDQAYNAARLARKAGITTVGFYMIGNMGETEATINETIRFARRCPTDYAQFTIMTPYPGTPVYRYLCKRGLIRDTDWSHYSIYHDPVFETPELSKESMKRLYGKAYRDFYLNPGFVLNKMMNIKKTDLKMAAAGVKMLFPRMCGSSN